MELNGVKLASPSRVSAMTTQDYIPDSFYGEAAENTPEEKAGARNIVTRLAADEADALFLQDVLGLAVARA